MENNNITLLVTAFMLVIVGVGLLTVIAQETQEATSLVTAINETIDNSGSKNAVAGGGGGNYSINTGIFYNLTNAYIGDEEWKQTFCSAISVTNHTNATIYTLVKDTDYNITSWGQVTFMNTSEVWNWTITNTTLITYVYCPDDYVASGWAQTILKLVPGFFALALVGIGIGLFYSVMKREGLLNI